MKCACSKNLLLKHQQIVAEDTVQFSGVELHRDREAFLTLWIVLAFDREARPAFFDRQPYCAAPKNVRAELQFDILKGGFNVCVGQGPNHIVFKQNGWAESGRAGKVVVDSPLTVRLAL